MHCGACFQGMTRHEADCSIASALQLPTTIVVLEGHHTRAAVPGRGSPPAPRWLGKGLATCYPPPAPRSPLDQRRPPPTSWAHRPPCCPTWACMGPRSVNDGYGAGGAPRSVQLIRPVEDWGLAKALPRFPAPRPEPATDHAGITVTSSTAPRSMYYSSHLCTYVELDPIRGISPFLPPFRPHPAASSLPSGAPPSTPAEGVGLARATSPPLPPPPLTRRTLLGRRVRARAGSGSGGGSPCRSSEEKAGDPKEGDGMEGGEAVGWRIPRRHL